MAPVGIMTSVVGVGIPPHQLPARFQLVVPPTQYPFGLTVTFVETGPTGPPQPSADTDMVADPLNAGSNTALTELPDPLMLFPAPETDQEYPVALVADVVKAMVLFWQKAVLPEGAEGADTSGLSTTPVVVVTSGQPPEAATV